VRLLTEPGVVVADVPVVRGRPANGNKRLVGRVLVSGVNAASMRAVNYASALGIEDVRAVHFAFSAEDAKDVRQEWSRFAPLIPLEVGGAPYRDIATQLLGYLRAPTAEERTERLVLLPETAARGWRRLLHSQRSRYVKRLVLCEPRVVLASVPYQLLR